MGCKNAIRLLLVFTILFLLIFICFFSINVTATSTPVCPSGPTSDFNHTEYEYTMNTSESSSSWMFDWGNGNYSNWIEIGESGNLASQSNSWSLSGYYLVRIKYRSKYIEESSMSSPLIVNVTVHLDSDNDGIYDYEDSDDDNDGVFDEINVF